MTSDGARVTQLQKQIADVNYDAQKHYSTMESKRLQRSQAQMNRMLQCEMPESDSKQNNDD